MPSYLYKCKSCDTHISLIQKMADRKVPDSCKNCGGTDMSQVITAPMFVLKGRGWANDGYNYQKTPADTLPGYSDKDSQAILPSRKKDITPPQPVEAPKLNEGD